MSFSNEERRRVEEDERYRIYSREQYALRREREAQEQASKIKKRRRYVAHHGDEGAFYKTLVKWMIGAVIWATLSFFGAINDEGFFKAVGAALISFVVVTGVGVARAYYVVNSAR